MNYVDPYEYGFEESMGESTYGYRDVGWSRTLEPDEFILVRWPRRTSRPLYPSGLREEHVRDDVPRLCCWCCCVRSLFVIIINRFVSREFTRRKEMSLCLARKWCYSLRRRTRLERERDGESAKRVTKAFFLLIYLYTHAWRITEVSRETRSWLMSDTSSTILFVSLPFLLMAKLNN